MVISDGSNLPADIVVVGTGARPASSLVKGQLDLDKQGGVLVDGYFKVGILGGSHFKVGGYVGPLEFIQWVRLSVRFVVVLHCA